MFNVAESLQLLPIKMCAATVAYDQFTPNWTLTHVENPDVMRTFVGNVQFETSFSNTPIIHIAISGFDIDQRDSSRVSATPEMITSTGFDIRINTWCETRVYKIEVSWLALGQA